MADEKKNPLIGAFRTPEPPKESPDPKPAQPPSITPPVQPKVEDTKKPEEPGKPTADPKTMPTTGTAAPAKAGEPKKSDEPGKSTADIKAPTTSSPVAPAKADEAKKPDEPGKPAADIKAPTTSGPVAPAKADEAKKPTEPPKTPGDGKPAGDTTPSTEDDLPKNLHIPLTQPGQPESVVTLSLADIHMFEGHPFNVNDDKDMWDLVESVKQFGVLEPAVVIPRKEGGYEMVSGHRRQRACDKSTENWTIFSRTVNVPIG